MPIFKRENVLGFEGHFNGKPTIVCLGCVDYPTALTEPCLEEFFKSHVEAITEESRDRGNIYVCDTCRSVLSYP